MEIRTLRYFLAAARAESITQAAEQLHLTQPNLSRQLRELEEELGTILFLRGNGITLTEEGRIFRRRAEEMMELLDKARSEVTAAMGSVSGDIYIGCAETNAMRIIIRLIKVLREQYPAIHFHITSGHEDVVTERLDRGILDLGVLIEPTKLKKYDSIRLPTAETWGVLIRRDDPLSEKECIKPGDLVDQPLICSSRELFQNQFLTWAGCKQESMNIIASYNLLFNASLMVEEGLGYAVCLDGIIPDVANHPLCFRPLEPRMTSNVYVVWKQYQVFSNVAQLFLSRLQNELESAVT